jgi:2-polyprenyl-3-methyl-5-hydroxy-6-metoxy-1,4-benzoquinol methylase
MKTIALPADSPASWQLSYTYDLLEIYNSLAHRGYTYAYKNRQARTLAAIDAVASPGAKILDLAAAQGNFSLALAERGYEVTWNDLRAELIDYVKQKHETGIIHYAAGNGFELEFPTLFDVVLIAEVIEHVAHPDDFLRKVASLVKPGGHIVMTTPNGGYFRNNLPRFSDCADPSQFEAQQFQPDSDGHIFLLHIDEIQRLAQQVGLQIQRQELFTNSLTNGHVKLEPLLKILPKSLVDTVERITSGLPLLVSKRLNVHMLTVIRKV